MGGACHKEARHGARVTEWLPIEKRNALDRFMRSDREIYGLDGKAEAGGGPARGGRLVEALVRHLHHEAKQIAGARFGGISGDQPAVDAARKKQPERHIAPQPQAHRLAEPCLELPKRIRPRAREAGRLGGRPVGSDHWRAADRKSTRLNSSHVAISYAV